MALEAYYAVGNPNGIQTSAQYMLDPVLQALKDTQNLALATMAAGAASAFAAFWAAMATGLSVREMRQTRRQQVRPHFAAEFAPPRNFALDADGRLDFALYPPFVFRNVGNGVAQSVYITPYCDAARAIERLEGEGLILSRDRLGPNARSTYRFESLRLPSKKGKLPDLARIRLPHPGLTFSINRFDFETSHSVPDVAMGGSVDFDLSSDQIMTIATASMVHSTLDETQACCMVQVAYWSVAGEFIMQEFWLSIEAAGKGRSVRLTPQRAVVSNYYGDVSRAVRKRRKSAQRWMKRERR